MKQLNAQNPKANVILMAFAEPHKNTDYENGKEPVEVSVHRRVAKHYGAVYINLAKEVYDRIKAGEFSWQYDFKDLHPSPYGQEVYFQTIKELLKLTPPDMATSRKPSGMDVYAYEKARYVDIEEATNLSGFKTEANWKPVGKVPTRAGFVDVPMLTSDTAGSSFTFNFKGRAVGIAIISGPDAGKIAYTIDGKDLKTLDLFTPWSMQLHLPWYLMLADELRSGKHTLKLTLLPEKNEKSTGSALRVVHFLVNE
jgi:sialidase-1